MKRVLFVCQDNAGLSQIAEAYARMAAPEEFEIYSAGIVPARQIDHFTGETMSAVGLDFGPQFSKPLSDLADLHYDAVITLGPQPLLQAPRAELEGHWLLASPNDMPPAKLAQLRDDIRHRVHALLNTLEATALDDAEGDRGA